jgi:hypothetical protein
MNRWRARGITPAPATIIAMQQDAATETPTISEPTNDNSPPPEPSDGSPMHRPTARPSERPPVSVTRLFKIREANFRNPLRTIDR